MNSRTIANGILRAIGIVLGILLFVYFLYIIQSVIVYIIIAGILSLIARPIILFLRRKLDRVAMLMIDPLSAKGKLLFSSVELVKLIHKP